MYDSKINLPINFQKGERHFPYLLLLTSEAVCPIKLYGILAQIHLSLVKMANTNTLYAICVKMNRKTDKNICIVVCVQELCGYLLYTFLCLILRMFC